MFSSGLDETASPTHILNMFRTSSTAWILGRRAGRIAFGLALVAGATVVFWGSTTGRDVLAMVGIHTPGPSGFHGVRLFELIWAGAIAVALIVRGVVWVVAPPPRGDALLKASLVAPAIGLALMLPLSLHMVVMRGSFDEWVRLSIRVVGVAHVAFAALFAARAAGLARSATPRISIGAIFLWTVLASFVPWPFIIPQALTAVTGLFILPVLFLFDAIAAHERTALAALPCARVV
jgi:hypothetical protein